MKTSSKSPSIDRTSKTLEALKQFKEGDRVFNKLTKQHGYFQAPNYKIALPDCWVRYEEIRDDELFISEVGIPTNPLNLELCLCQSSMSSPELADSLMQVSLSEDSSLKRSLKSTPTLSPSLEATGEISQSTLTSEIITPPEGLLTLPQSAFPALIPPVLETEPELTENLAPSGLKPCESSTNADPDLLLSKTPQDYSIEEWEQYFKVYPKAGTFANGRLSPQQPLERPTLEKGYSLLPTLTSGDKTPNSRAAGQTKCEIWFRKHGLLANSQCLSPQMMALLQGFSKDWTKCLLESQEETLDELKADTSLVDVSAPPKPPLCLEGSSTLPELTIDEERDRQHLERKIESAFIKAESVFRDAVKALKEIRDRRLYRSSHATFEEYCKDRFGFSRRRPYQLIDAAVVLENLEKCEQIVHILPTKESHCRELAELSDPEEQREAWISAIESNTKGKIPAATVIKSVVEQIKERTAQLPPPDYKVGEVVEIRSGGTKELRKHDGMWGIVSHVGSIRCTVHISLRNVTLQCKPTEMDKVHPMYTADIQAVSERIKELSKLDLNPAVWAILETLAHQTCFDELQMELLEWVEKKYGLS